MQKRPGRRARRPAVTEKGREDQLISLAVDLAEKQIVEGTASSQVVTHFLKLGSSRERLEQQRLEGENQLLKAKLDALAAGQRIEELYSSALDAMKEYKGQDPTEEDTDER
jgi:hypothetical protein